MAAEFERVMRAVFDPPLKAIAFAQAGIAKNLANRAPAGGSGILSHDRFSVQQVGEPPLHIGLRYARDHDLSKPILDVTEGPLDSAFPHEALYAEVQASLSPDLKARIAAAGLEVYLVRRTKVARP